MEYIRNKEERRNMFREKTWSGRNLFDVFPPPITKPALQRIEEKVCTSGLPVTGIFCDVLHGESRREIYGAVWSMSFSTYFPSGISVLIAQGEGVFFACDGESIRFEGVGG